VCRRTVPGKDLILSVFVLTITLAAAVVAVDR
jgi:hypothetical protein